MIKKEQSTIQRISLLTGIILMVSAAVLLVCWLWGIRTAPQRSEQLVHTLRTLIPEPQGAVPEARSDNTMPVLSLEGTDFVGILEIPRYGSVLPVGAKWGQISKYPCHFHGSVYDSSLQIGGTTQKGQYDFYRELSVGDNLYFTDMAGNRYSYAVTDLRYEKHADQAVLQRKDAALTLFIKNVYAFEYIVVFCDVLN